VVKKVQAQMSTEVALDMLKASESIKSITTRVNSFTQSWKASEAQMKSAGDYVGAATAKYEGLGKSITAQQDKIAKLKKGQSELKGSTEETAQEYLKYQRQIDQATTRLSSLEAQQNRAAQSMKYQKSGLAGLQNAYKESQQASQLFVDRLQAEHKTASANIESYKQLKNNLSNLKQQMAIQQSEESKYKEKLDQTTSSYNKQLAIVKRFEDANKQNTQQYRNAHDRLDQLSSSLKQASGNLDTARGHLNKTATEFAKTNDEAKAMNRTVSKLRPTGITRIDNKIVALKDHSSIMATAVKRNFASIKSAAISASIGVGIIGGVLVSGAKKASTLQNTYVENTNLMTTAGEKYKTVQKAVNQMQQDGQKYSVQYGESQEKIASGYQELIKRGYSSTQALGSMKSILQASKASGDDFDDTMHVTTSTLEAFGMKSNNAATQMKNTSKVANTLAMAADATSTNFSDLGVGMSYVGTTAKQAGLSLKDTASAMGVLSNNGIESDKAGTGLRKTINSLISPTKTGTDAMKQYGLSISDFKDKSGKLKDTKTIFDQINKAVPKKDQANFFHNVFGTTGQNAAAVLAANTDQLKKVNEQVGGAYKNNYVGKLADKNMKSTQNSTKQFKEAAQAVQIELGTALMPALAKAAKGMAKAFETKNFQAGLKTFAKGIGDTANALVSFVEFVGKHGKTIKTFGEIMLGAFVSTKVISGILRIKDAIGLIRVAQTTADLKELGAVGKSVGAIKLGAKWIGDKAVSAGKLALNGLKTVGRGIGKALTFTAKIAVKGAQLALKGLLTAAQVTGRGLKTAFMFLKANPFIAIISGVALVVTALVALYKHNKKFRNFVNGIAKDAKKYIGKAVDAVKSLGKWAGNIGKGAKKGWNNFTRSTSTGAKNAIKSFVSLKNDAGKHLSNLWKSGKTTFSNGWKTVTNASKSGAHNVGNWFNSMANDTRKKAIQMFNNHKATFQSGYKVLNNLTNTWHDYQTGRWDKLGSDLKNTANSIRSFVHNIFADMYNKLNQMTGGRLGDMVNAWKSKMSAIGNTVSDAKESIHKHFVDLVRGIVKPFNDMLSGLEKGINWVLDKVGASKISGDWSVPMPSYAQGTKDTHQGGLAKVNDGNGAHYREMYHLPNGQIGMFPAVKNMIVPLPKGTSILDGNKSALLAKMMGIPGYASGVGDFFSGLWNGAKDVLDDTEDILKKPAEFMESLFKHFLGNTSSKISLANDILTNFPTTVAKGAVDWIKKQFQSIANPTGTGVAQWEPIIKAVAASMNFNISGGQVSKLLKQIQTESGGNATVKQGISDINSREGHPAQGLLQFIPSTFAHWALKGHTNILNGADQIMAAINALNHGGEGGWSNIGNGHGWENGGIVRNWQYAQIAEHNKPEAVLPLDAAKDSRAWQVLKAVVDAKTGGKSLDNNNATTTTSNADGKIAELTSVVNSMATMMKTIIRLNADQLTATKGIVGYDSSKVYRQQSTDQSLASFQSFS
jgi:TP901 family phage tail tape measure protein